MSYISRFRMEREREGKFNKAASLKTVRRRKESTRKIIIPADYMKNLGIDDLVFPLKYRELIAKLMEEFPEIKYVSQLFMENVERHIKLSVSLHTYYKLYLNLRRDLDNVVVEAKKNAELHQAYRSFPKKYLNKARINHSQLSKPLMRLLEKLSKHYGDKKVSKLEFLLEIDTSQLLALRSFGKITISNLVLLQNRIKQALYDFQYPGEQLETKLKDYGLLIFDIHQNATLEEVETIMIEDTDRFLDSLNSVMRDITVSRWGYQHSFQTLNEIALRHDYTRERVRQCLLSSHKQLNHSTRVSPKLMSGIIKDNGQESFVELFPRIAKRFESEELFFRFLNVCCGSDKKIRQLFNKLPPIPDRFLMEFFKSNPSPSSEEFMKRAIMERFKCDEDQALRIIQKWQASGHLVNRDGVLNPVRLSHTAAIHNVLINYPNGAHWKKVVRAANRLGICRNPIPDHRVSHAFKHKEYVCLIGVGNYLHRMYLQQDPEEAGAILKKLCGYMKKHNERYIKLEDYLSRIPRKNRSIGFYQLRQIIIDYGEKYFLRYNHADKSILYLTPKTQS